MSSHCGQLSAARKGGGTHGGTAWHRMAPHGTAQHRIVCTQRGAAQHSMHSTAQHSAAAHLGIHAHNAVVLSKQLLQEMPQRVAVARSLCPAARQAGWDRGLY